MTDFNELLRQVKDEMAQEPKTKVNKPKPIAVDDALKHIRQEAEVLRQEAEANRDPRLKYLDRFKGQLLDSDYKDITNKIVSWDLRQDEIEDELRRCGVDI